MFLFLLFQICDDNDMGTHKWSRMFDQKPKLIITTGLAISLLYLYFMAIIYPASNDHMTTRISGHETENTSRHRWVQFRSSEQENTKRPQKLPKKLYPESVQQGRPRKRLSKTIREDPSGERTYRLPQALVIGAKKCGTGWLWLYLQLYIGISMFLYLTHWGQVTHICAIKLSHHWLR